MAEKSKNEESQFREKAKDVASSIIFNIIKGIGLGFIITTSIVAADKIKANPAAEDMSEI